MKCIFIYNPVGGTGKIAKKKDDIVRELKEVYDEVDEYATKCAGDMSRAAREAADAYDAIIFAGGDGSVNEVMQGIGDLEKQPLLGYIPSGTVNDVAHSLKIPKKVKKALKIIKQGHSEYIDCMKLNDRYAVYVATTGAFTSATYNTSQAQKKRMGWLAYGLEGLKHNLKFKPFDVRCAGAGVDYQSDGCILIAFINSRYVAGFGMNKRADLQDGEIEVAIVERKKKANFFRVVGSYFTLAGLFLFGYRKKSKHIVRLKGSSFDVELADDIVWNIDGEKGFGGSMHVEVLPKKMRILVPETKKRKKARPSV